MPIVTDVSAANHVAIRAVGKISKEDIAAFRNDFERMVRDRGQLNVLFDATEFTGWDAGALWQEAKFDAKHFSKIDRLAMVGSAAWQRAMEAAVKPLAHPAMHYFGASEMDAAHAWLVGETKP